MTNRDFMPRLLLGLAAAACAFRADAAPQEEKQEAFTMKAKYLKGDKISVEGTAKVTLNLSMKAEAMTVKMEMEEQDQAAYETQILDVTEQGAVRKELREYTKARGEAKVSMSIGDEGEEPIPVKKTLPLEGRSFEITEEEGSTKVTPKGDTKDLPKALDRSIPVHQGVEALLPGKEVRKGDRWSVEGKRLKAWMERQVPNLKKVKDVTGSFECTLKEISGADGKRTARVEYTLDVEITVDIAALMAAEVEEEEEEEKPAAKPKGEMVLRIKRGKGEFTFNIDEGTSVSQEVEAAMEIDFSQQIGDQETTGKGKGSIHVKNGWKLQERKSE